MNQRQQLLEQIRRESIQKRAQALREAAQRQAFNAPIAAAGATGSGSGGRGGCLPAGGVMLTFDGSIFDIEGSFRVFLAEDGVENDRPVYTSQAIEKDGTEITSFGLRVRWNGSLWEFIFLQGEGGELFSYIAATSPELYTDEWNTVEDIAPSNSSPGEEFLCEWRYCQTVTGEGYINVQPFMSAWNEIPLTEFPNIFLPLDGRVDPIFWSPEDQSWVTGFEEPIILGGTREELPIGSFDIGFGRTLTISAGVCSISPSEL